MFYFVYLLLVVSCRSMIISDRPRALSIKKTPRRGNSIAVGARNFKEFVQNSDVFVDKTDIIWPLMNSLRNHTMLALPQKWGKTINLHMIKNFFEISVDQDGKPIPSMINGFSYNFFKHGEVTLNDSDFEVLQQPPVISKRRAFCEKNHGQYPVIFVNLTNLPHEHIITHMAERIADTFAEHRYLERVYNDIISKATFQDPQQKKAAENLSQFQAVLNKTANQTELVKSLSLLSRLLYEHFSQKHVFILIDDYDEPYKVLLNNDVDEEQENSIIQFLIDFVEETFKFNPYLKKGVLTATLRISKLIPCVEELFETNAPRRHFYHYFGFSEIEADLLFNHMKISDEQKEWARYWFKYSNINKGTKDTIYNPHSIANFLNSNKTGVYCFQANRNDSFIQKMLDYKNFKNAMIDLVTGKTYTTGYLSDHNIDLLKVKRNTTTVQCGNKLSRADFKQVITYLYALGYLGIQYERDAETKANETSYSGLINAVNVEAKHAMFDEIIIYYKTKCNFFSMILENTILEFINLVEGHSSSSLLFIKAFQYLLADIPTFHEVSKSNIIYFLINYFAVQTAQQKNYRVENFPHLPQPKPDVVFYNDNRIILMKAFYNSSEPKAVVEEMKAFNLPEGLQNTKVIKYIGITYNIRKRVGVYIESKVKD